MALQKVPIVLQINCGYARGAIFEFSKGQCKSKEEVAQLIQNHFSSAGFLNKPSSYWESNFSESGCFDRAIFAIAFVNHGILHSYEMSILIFFLSVNGLIFQPVNK